MSDVKAFIQQKTVQLLEYLDGDAPASTGDMQPLDFVDSVLMEWTVSFTGRKLPPPTLQERAFWYTLYQFEELEECKELEVEGLELDYCNDNQFAELLAHCGGDIGMAGYITLMADYLATAKELLRTNRDLPHMFFASRPGEDFDDEEFELFDPMNQIRDKITH